jgi:hypothetical protein
MGSGLDPARNEEKPMDKVEIAKWAHRAGRDAEQRNWIREVLECEQAKIDEQIRTGIRCAHGELIGCRACAKEVR